jgi:hypothetical protein
MKHWMQSKRMRRWAIAASVMLLLAALAAWNWQGIRIWYHMAPIGDVFQVPPFDAQKAKSLSPERRAELERELFSELWMWSGSSRRFGPPNGRAERQARWIEMAQEGSELAYLTLKVLPPDSFARDPRPTLKRLEAMAQQGDAAAMCLYGGIVFQLPYWVADWTPQENRARYWTEQGAALGHPQCLIALGGRLMDGADGYPKELRRGFEMVSEALRQDYIHGAWMFSSHSIARGFSELSDRKLIYCWDQQVARTRHEDADLNLKVNAHTDAPPEQRAALERELNELRKWHPSTEDCIKLTQETLGD